MDEVTASVAFSNLDELEGYVISWGDGEIDDYEPGQTPTHIYVDDNPTSTASDVYTITITAFWSGEVSATNQTTITISNRPPTAFSDVATVAEDWESAVNGTITNIASEVTINVLANDTDPSAHDVLRVLSVDNSATKGIAVVNANGTITYRPNGKFDHLGIDESEGSGDRGTEDRRQRTGSGG